MKTSSLSSPLLSSKSFFFLKLKMCHNGPEKIMNSHYKYYNKKCVKIFFDWKSRKKRCVGKFKQTTLFLLLVFMNLWQRLISNFVFFIWWRENNFVVTVLETTWAKMMLDVNISIKFIHFEKSQTIFDASTLESGINIPLCLLIFWLFSRGYGLI